MRPIILTYVLLFAVLNFAFVIPKSGILGFKDNIINWQVDDPLTWEDFEGRSKSWSNISALTASAIEYAYECQNGQLDVTVKAIFIPEESWAKSDAKNDHILEHEQLHFDITEIYARKLRQQISEEVKTCNDIYKIESISQVIIDEWQVEQAKYDSDSKHSIDEEMQELWSEKISLDLINSEDYALLVDDLNN